MYWKTKIPPFGRAIVLYVAAGAEFEPITLWTKGDESTNEPPLPTFIVKN